MCGNGKTAEQWIRAKKTIAKNIMAKVQNGKPSEPMHPPMMGCKFIL
jgi:hypothetical protein